MLVLTCKKLCIYLHTKNKFRQYFFKILQKYYQLPILGTLDMSSHFYKKTIMSTCKYFVYLLAKKQTPWLTFFLRYCKDIANSLLWLLWECLIMPINNDSITLQETLMHKVLKSTWRKLWCLSECKKLTSSLTSFLRNYEDIANLLFRELWKCMTIKKYSINLKEIFMLICKQKINFITYFFLKIFKKPQHRFEETFNVYLQAKNQLYPSHFPWVIAKILQIYYLGYFGHASLRTPKVILSACRKRLYLSAGKKTTSSPMFFWRYTKYIQFS